MARFVYVPLLLALVLNGQFDAPRVSSLHFHENGDKHQKQFAVHGERKKPLQSTAKTIGKLLQDMQTTTTENGEGGDPSEKKNESHFSVRGEAMKTQPRRKLLKESEPEVVPEQEPGSCEGIHCADDASVCGAECGCIDVYDADGPDVEREGDTIAVPGRKQCILNSDSEED